MSKCLCAQPGVLRGLCLLQHRCCVQDDQHSTGSFRRKKSFQTCLLKLASPSTSPLLVGCFSLLSWKQRCGRRDFKARLPESTQRGGDGAWLGWDGLCDVGISNAGTAKVRPCRRGWELGGRRGKPVMWGKKLERREVFIRVTARTACLSLSVQGLAGDLSVVAAISCGLWCRGSAPHSKNTAVWHMPISMTVCTNVRRLGARRNNWLMSGRWLEAFYVDVELEPFQSVSCSGKGKEDLNVSPPSFCRRW